MGQNNPKTRRNPNRLAFSKYQGAGNDFLIIDDRVPFFPTEDVHLIQRLCHRRFGIGADGIILLQNDGMADFRMQIFNSDGSEAESCGNGLRCLARFIADIRGESAASYKIWMHDQIVEAFVEKEKISIALNNPRDLKLHVQQDVHFIDTGVPHAVVFVADVQKIDLNQEGKALRSHPCFGPKGSNVNFASLQSDGSISVRTFERGVEGETLACGTGAAAVAAIAAQIYNCSGPIRTRFSGGDLEISFSDEGLKLAGPAVRVFEGTFDF
ncbi:MAG: diaminopimelate epimerase [Chlamydiae bacterium RIFCSPHIGHO2_12_FULL_49_9]|nr:MAG: diaminopimelate epimerase [Chlamydiae bacterium RIFCSPHIGHO2_12_FULL_49_9]